MIPLPPPIPSKLPPEERMRLMREQARVMFWACIFVAAALSLMVLGTLGALLYVAIKALFA